VTNLELTKTICRILDKKLDNRSPFESLIEFVEDRLGHDVTYTVDYLRTTQMLGWEPKTELSDGLDKTIDWYLNKLL
jgi:dTDP-glucose 4,6-dehydratase